MGSVNKAIVLGNLGADPELRHTASGQAVCELRVCTNERWTDKQGETQERSEWHRIVCWGKQGENAARYLQKGRQIYVEGRIQTREYQDRDGNKRYATEIVAREVVFLSGDGGGRKSQTTPADDDFDDDKIPF
tara:strand:- start:2033 stop:2431 length:399 start_codon:yes stop_codon:yes gene_type:complete